MASALDWAVRFKGYAPFFHRASHPQQAEIVDIVSALPLIGRQFRAAADLALAAALGAAENDSVTRLIGWPGPNGGYYALGRHPLERWRQPARLTEDGNLP